MKITFLFLFFLLPFFSKAQETINGKVVPLHSSVGEIITIDEKNKFVLFPEYKDSMYQSAMLIKHPDYTFAFLIKPKKGIGDSFERVTTEEEMIEMCDRIDKIMPGEPFFKQQSLQLTPANSTAKTYSSEQNEKNYTAGRVFDAFFGAVIKGIITAPFKKLNKLDTSENEAPASPPTTITNKEEKAVYGPRGEGKSHGNRKE